MNHYQTICLFLFLFVGGLFAKGQEVSPFPCQEFLNIETTGPDFDTIIFYPNGQVKAMGLSLATYHSIWDKEFYELSNKHRIWKEYYENGNLKFAYKYPPKGFERLGLLDRGLIFIGRGKHSGNSRQFPIAFFYRPDGSIICKGGLIIHLFHPYIAKCGYWMYYDDEETLLRQDFLDKVKLDTTAVDEVILNDSIGVADYYLSAIPKYNLIGKNGLMIEHLTQTPFWSSDFHTNGNRLNVVYYPGLDDLSIKVNSLGKLEKLKFSFPSRFGIDTIQAQKIECLTVDNPSFDYYRSTYYDKGEFQECGLCIEDSCKYFFYDVFELYFENDSLIKSYGYYQDCDGGEKYENIGRIFASNSNCYKPDYNEDIEDYLIKREEITDRMRAHFGEEELKAVYEYIDETFDNLFPKKYRARYKLSRMNR